MYLSCVLEATYNFSSDLGITQTSLYMLLFEEKEENNIFEDINQKAKNVFSKGKTGRALTQSLMSKMTFNEGDIILSERIRTRWLTKVGGHEAIYNELCHLLNEDKYMPECEKQALISCCD